MISAILDPLSPVEKFSINLTAFFSSGTDVPPEVNKVMVLSKFFAVNYEIKALIFCNY
jgi:hypothetical protein